MFGLFALFSGLLCAWLLPWRAWGLRRPMVFAALFIPLSLYLYANLGWESGLRAKAALTQFEDTQSEADLEKLHRVLDQHLARKTDDLAAILKGRLLFAQKDYQGSSHYFKQAFEHMPNDADLMVEYGTVLYLLESPELDAVTKRIERLEEQPIAAHSLLANVAMDKADYATAIQHWEAMLAAIRPENPQYAYIEALIVSLKQLDNDARELPAETVPDQS